MDMNMVRKITGLIGLGLLFTFILGLAHSISTGFAGFWGGLPFWVISIIVLSMVAYDYWDECIRKRR
jgi:adenylate kinase